MNTCRDKQAFRGKIAAQISQFIVPGPKFLETSTMPDIAKSDISPNLDRDKMFNELWWLNYCFCEGVGIGAVGNPFFGGEAVNICLHSRCEMTDVGDPFAPTSAFACASQTSVLCPQPKDLQSAFASTKSLRVVMDGVASNSLTGLPALVTPSGSTTSSAWVWAFLPRKPMAVLCLLSRRRSCASRAEQS